MVFVNYPGGGGGSGGCGHSGNGEGSDGKEDRRKIGDDSGGGGGDGRGDGDYSGGGDGGDGGMDVVVVVLVVVVVSGGTYIVGGIHSSNGTRATRHLHMLVVVSVLVVVLMRVVVEVVSCNRSGRNKKRLVSTYDFPPAHLLFSHTINQPLCLNLLPRSQSHHELTALSRMSTRASRCKKAMIVGRPSMSDTISRRGNTNTIASLMTGWAAKGLTSVHRCQEYEGKIAAKRARGPHTSQPQ